MDNEDLSYIGVGVCRKCESHVVFAFSTHLETRIETKKCLNCGQVYQRDVAWKVKVEDKEK